MIDTHFTRAKVLARYEQSLLQPHLSDLAAGLHEQGYSDNVIRAYLSAAEKFGRWLSMANLNTSDVNEDLIARYLDEAVRRHPPSTAGRSDSHARTGLAHLVRILREKQVIPPAAVTPPQTAAERWLNAFEQTSCSGCWIRSQHPQEVPRARPAFRHPAVRRRSC